MHELQDVNVAQAKIIEHRRDGDVNGVVIYGGVAGGRLVLGWSHGVSQRRTEFDPDRWEIEAPSKAGIIPIKRKLPNDPQATFDQPWADADHYTLELEWG